jgi:hypothetical protein
MPLTLYILWVGTVALMAVTFVGIVVFFPDGPIHQCGGDFRGKSGQHHAAAEYNDYMKWQFITIVTWLLGVPINAGCALLQKLRY